MIARARGWAVRALVQAALLVSVLALIWGGVWLQVRLERIATEHDVAKETSNLALAFEENIVRSITAIDQVILFLRDSYARDPARFDLLTWARERPFINDQIFQYSLVDASGRLVQSTLATTAEPVNVSDREHFRVHVDSRQDELFISRPVLGRVSNRYSLQFTRRIVGLDGEFLGVVVVSVDPYYLARFYDSLELGHGFVMLTGLDGYLRAGRPATALLGSPLAELRLSQPPVPLEHGSYQVAAAVMTGKPAFVSYRGLADYKLIVAVGYGTDEMFATYRLHRFQYVVAGIGLSALVLCAGILLSSHRRSLAAYQSALTATLENMSQGIIMVGADRRIAVINRRAGELLGLPPRLMRENTSFDAVIRWQVERGEFASQHRVTASMSELLDRGGLDASVPVYERTRPNGTVLEVRTALLPNGGAVRTYTDISERTRYEQQLAAARDGAEAGVRARSQFLTVMSHEIRTPLNGIIGAAGLLLDRDLDPEELHYAQIIRQSGDHLLQLINDILDFSRLDACCMELEEVVFDLHATITLAVDLFADAARAKGLDLALTIAEPVPLRVVGDPGRLRQVLLNLVGNAVKFTEHGTVRVDVTGGSREVGGGVRTGVAVIDTGIGISEVAASRLFQEFSQGDSSISRRFGGSGLGLAISRRLVERMGGSLRVESSLGRGSTFRFDILLQEASLEDLKNSEPEVGAEVALPKLRILLVEDNGTNRLVATRMVERMGHRVDAAADGAEAVRAVCAIPYDLVLMDVMMPEMDGLAATRLIRAEPAPVGHTPIIGLTANAERSKEAACHDAGMDGFVSKPVTAERLATAIRTVIAARMRDGAGDGWPLLDNRVLHHLADDIGGDGAIEVVRLFLTEAPRMVERLEQAAASQGRSLLREVHTLASAARSVGLTQVGHVATDIEKEIAAGEPCAERLAALLDLTRRSIARLAEWELTQQAEAAGVT